MPEKLDPDIVREYLSTTDEGRKILAPIVDSAVGKGVATYQTGHPTPDISGLEAEIKQLKITNYAITESQKRGVDYGLLEELELTFDDTVEVDRRLDTLAERFAISADRERNETLASGFKPGGSSGVPDRIDVSKQSAKRLAFLDSIGELDSLLES